MLGDAHQQGTHDAVHEAERRRHAPVRASRIIEPSTTTEELHAALAFEAHSRSPKGRTEKVRSIASMLSHTAGKHLRGEAEEPELRATEDDMIAAIHARRSA